MTDPARAQLRARLHAFAVDCRRQADQILSGEAVWVGCGWLLASADLADEAVSLPGEPETPADQELVNWLRTFADTLESNDRSEALYMQEICGLRQWAKKLDTLEPAESPISGGTEK